MVESYGRQTVQHDPPACDAAVSVCEQVHRSSAAHQEHC
jgi:hypothetical protein